MSFFYINGILTKICTHLEWKRSYSVRLTYQHLILAKRSPEKLSEKNVNDKSVNGHRVAASLAARCFYFAKFLLIAKCSFSGP